MSIPLADRSSDAVPLAEVPLRGPGGEPVDLWRTIRSHGVAELPPARVDEQARALRVTLRPLSAGAPFSVRIREATGAARIDALGPAPSAEAAAAAVARLLRLDEDLSPFYARAAEDPELAWAAAGAGRMLRCGSVFEDVVKTVCTTNCSWSATERMVEALVAHLGEPAPGAPRQGWEGRAFPTPQAVAEAPESFFRDVARAGYRGRYLVELSSAVAAGDLDLEELGRADERELPDAELAARLLALPGVGPYATAHIMMMLGRYSRLILDAWTRPTYLRISGRRRAADRTIERRFARYGRYRGLAFWLYLTRDWVEAAEAPPVAPPAASA